MTQTADREKFGYALQDAQKYQKPEAHASVLLSMIEREVAGSARPAGANGRPRPDYATSIPCAKPLGAIIVTANASLQNRNKNQKNKRPAVRRRRASRHGGAIPCAAARHQRPSW
ncbi:hypothetical protein [Burkholderia glumae]|uniref:hypothetical protein n=1 Tax=Burkholderia glumae TaxID=337 RepID=UPI00148ED4A6|nr:hypothetical protein [Burkholderia glumae]MCM2492719.1 hypothetical protein [Burkholderia glumae]MCM2543666.1 hypothetical protein [Burkholderia glumae]MCQ0034395.1 hypothetical protein [Burkholderia glumae]MCQ0039483.1 hypothetical protein [Burkholderia glumae]QJW77321.1 hypothetical protein GAS18_15800 [Burkholderia glumae]